MDSSARTPRHLGALIRQERKKQQLTQAELGERIGLRQATVSRLESGEPGTQLRTLFDALTALNLELRVVERQAHGADDIERLF